MSPYSPGVLFRTTNPGKTGDQARALNQDGSDNTTDKSVSVGQEITVFLTGHGAVDGLPDDGVAPGSAQPMGGETPRLFIQLNSTSAVECKDNVASTIDPDEPGVWRVKCKIPTLPANGTFNLGFWVLYRSMASHLLFAGATGANANLPLITVKQ